LKAHIDKNLISGSRTAAITEMRRSQAGTQAEGQANFHLPITKSLIYQIPPLTLFLCVSGF